MLDVHVLKTVTRLQITCKNVTTETINQSFEKCGCDVGDMSATDTEFQELFAQTSSETTLDGYINFEADAITYESAVDPTHVDWQQECREKTLKRSCNQKLLF